MRALVYGGRDFVGDTQSFVFLNDFLRIYPQLVRGKSVDVVISGGAKGADTFGETWAKFWGIPVERFPADWDTHGKAAGHIRNQQMLASGVDIAIEFPGGRGTADMRRRLDKAGVEVIEYEREST